MGRAITRKRGGCEPRRFPQLLLVAATAASALGCGEATCGAACVSNVVFDLSTPVAGQSFRVMARGGTVACGVPADASALACDHIGDQGMMLSFASDGRLSQVTLEYPAPGPIQLVIEADGVVQVNQTFDYQPQGTHRVCGMTCYDSAHFVIQ